MPKHVVYWNAIPICLCIFSGHRLTTWWADLWMFISLVGPSSSWGWGHIIFRLILFLQKKNPFCSNKKHVKLDKYMANIPKSCCEVREWCVFSCHACWRRGTHSSPRRHERERWRPLSFSGALLIMDPLVVTWLSWPLQHHINHHCICTYSIYIYDMFDQFCCHNCCRCSAWGWLVEIWMERPSAELIWGSALGICCSCFVLDTQSLCFSFHMIGHWSMAQCYQWLKVPCLRSNKNRGFWNNLGALSVASFTNCMHLSSNCAVVSGSPK